MMVRFALFLVFALSCTPDTPTRAEEQGGLAEGFEAYLHKDFATAARIFGPLAERGEPHAQYMLGALHAHDEGLGRDPVRAHAWLSLAADRGHDDAARLRDGIARGMTAEQIAEAKALAADFGER